MRPKPQDKTRQGLVGKVAGRLQPLQQSLDGWKRERSRSVFIVPGVDKEISHINRCMPSNARWPSEAGFYWCTGAAKP